MSLLVLFVLLYLGINVRVSIILGVIELVIVLAFAFYRFGKKVFIAGMISCLIGVGLSFIRPNFNKSEYSGIVEEVKENYFIFNSTFEKLYVYQREHSFEIGDILSIKGSKVPLDFEILESNFNFQKYLNNKGVYSQMYPTSIEVKFRNPIRVLSFKKEFLSHFSSNSKALIGSFLFSMGSDEDVYTEMRSLHLNRLLSNSGFYLTILYSFLAFCVSRFIKKDKYKDLVLIGLFIPTFILSYPRFVVIKFVFLKLLRWINNHLLKKKFSYLELVSFSGIFFLIINPFYAYQDGFLLTYLIPISAFFFQNSFKGYKPFQKKLLISGLILIEFIPFALAFYQEVSIVSIIYHIILSPFFVLYYFLSLLSITHIPIYGIVNGYGDFLSQAISFFSKYNLTIYGIEMSNLTILLFEVLFFIFVYYLSSRFKPMIYASSGLLLILNLFYFIPLNSLFNDQVFFINVGQGDATLIRRKDTAILIDTGGHKSIDMAKETLIPFFKKNQIYDIDLLITTHDDFDHSGAVNSLIENFTVKRYEKDYKSFPISIGGFNLINYNIYPELWNEENDRSLVIGFNTKEYHYLIMGDAPKKIESRIMKDNVSIPCDILKVGHHGSNTSSGDAFIKYLSPKVGVISCGKKNKYGHPHSEVVAILNKYKVRIRRTDLEGTITYY